MAFNTLQSSRNTGHAEFALVPRRSRLHYQNHGRKPVLKRSEVSNDDDHYRGSVQRLGWRQGSIGPFFFLHRPGLQRVSGKPGPGRRNRAALLHVRQTTGRDGAATRGHTALCIPGSDPHLTLFMPGTAAVGLRPRSTPAGSYRGVTA